MIPAIDVTKLDGTAGERRDCGEAICRACEEVGFFYIINHGVDLALQSRVFDIAGQFFALPLDEKMQVALSEQTGFMGYFPLKGEVTDPLLGGDPKEGFDIALGTYHPWPDRPAQMRPILVDYYGAMSALGCRLSRGFALALGLPEAFFAAKLDCPTAILRLLHYPPLDQKPNSDVPPLTGCGAHSDYGYLTILAQDTQGGLQVETRAGHWVDVPPVNGALLCNIGEMMALWTNQRFRATPHRVIRLAKAARISIPFFFHPNPDVLIETLPTCCVPGDKMLPAPVTSGEYLHRRQSGAYV